MHKDIYFSVTYPVLSLSYTTVSAVMLLAALAWWYVHLLDLFTSVHETLSHPSGFHQLVHLV